jgi:hypothetical protein
MIKLKKTIIPKGKYQAKGFDPEATGIYALEVIVSKVLSSGEDTITLLIAAEVPDHPYLDHLLDKIAKDFNTMQEFKQIQRKVK